MTAPVRGLGRLDRDECLRLLEAESVGRLIVMSGGRPDVFPVNYAMDGDDIVFRTDEGTKLDAQERAKASFEIDSVDHDAKVGWSVVASGRLEEVTPYDGGRYDRVRALPIEPWAGGAKAHWMRLVPDRVTGRYIRRHE